MHMSYGAISTNRFHILKIKYEQKVGIATITLGFIVLFYLTKKAPRESYLINILYQFEIALI